MTFLGLGFQTEAADETGAARRPSQEQVFAFKAGRKLIGASIEIFYSNGDRIVCRKLRRKKVIVDFSNVRVGEYTIRIEKGEYTQVYQYLKK